jgi:PAS domain S-box-containing protein
MSLTEFLDLKTALQGRRLGLRELGFQACVAGLYFVTGKLGLALAFDQSFLTPVWPAAGVALAILILLGYGMWPGVLLGSLLLCCVTFSSVGSNWLATTGAALCVAAGNTLAALAGAWLVEAYAGGREAFRQPHTILLFVALAAVGTTALNATSGVLAYGLAHLAGWQTPGRLWLAWWLGDIVGVIVFAPLILVWSDFRWRTISTQRAIEAACLFGLLLLGCWITFGGSSTTTRTPVSSFLVVPLVLWTAFRFGQKGTTVVTFIVGCLATVGTLRGHGPFAVASRDISLLLLQDFIGVLAVMTLILAADVAQRHRTDADLRVSEQRYWQLFENNPQPTWVFDYESLRVLAVNSAALEHYGYSREEFAGLSLEELWLPEDREAVLKSLAETRQLSGVRQTIRHRKKDGKVIEVEIARKNLSFDGRPAGLALVLDVTERVRTERAAAALADLARRLSAANDPKQAAEKILETAVRLWDCDQAMLQLGLSDSPTRATIYRRRNADDAALETSEQPILPKELIQRVLQQGPQLNQAPAPLAAREVTGESGPKIASSFSEILVPVRMEVRPLGVLAIQTRKPKAFDLRDVRLLETLADQCAGALDRLRTEAVLHETDERLRLALSASRMGIWTIELTEPRRLFISPELETILKFAPAEFDGSEQALFERIAPEDHQEVRQAITRAIKIEGDYEVEFRLTPRESAVTWVLARGRAWVNVQGQPDRLIGVAIDVTDLKRAEEEVLRLNADLEKRVSDRTAQLEAINQELEAFSYSVSHDLRAPLRSIRGFCQVLLDRYAHSLDERGRDFLNRAAESSRHMDSLIEDLLQLSRISRAELHFKPVDLSALARTIADELKQSDLSRTVEFNITPGLHAVGEQRLLRVVLENLLRNAWKFTSKKPTARIEFGRAPGSRATFYVRDDGAGFDMRFADRLFGVFQRVHSTAEFPGTGIGLASVQRILNRHGGKAWAEGELQAGATFYFTLPSREDL